MLTLLVGIADAAAHASLNASNPQDGTVLEAAPPRFSLTFSEPVSPLSLNLVKPDASSIPLDRFVLRDSILDIEAPAGLLRGTYVLSWRVVSEDGHPVGGSVIFSVGEASAAPPIVEDQAHWSIRAGLWLSKIALYLGLFVGIGGVFACRVLMPGVIAGRRVVTGALLIGLFGAVISVGFQGLDALDADIGRIGEMVIWSTGFGTSYGDTVSIAVVALILAATGLVIRGPVGVAVATLALIGVGLALCVSGHASAAKPQWLMRPMVFLHAVAIGVWFGALAPLGLALERGEVAALPALRKFSRMIPLVVAVLAVAGTVLAVVQVGRPAALVDTAYGQVFLVKLALLLGLFALAAINRWSLTAPAEAGDRFASRRLARSIAIETLVVILIFGVAAAWRFTPPPRAIAAAAALPESIHIHTAKAMAEITVTPGRAGPVDVSTMIMTGDSRPLEAKEVTLVFSNPSAGIEPFRRQAVKPGNGTWQVDDVTLPIPGLWKVRVDILISDFEIIHLDGELKIRP